MHRHDSPVRCKGRFAREGNTLTRFARKPIWNGASQWVLTSHRKAERKTYEISSHLIFVRDITSFVSSGEACPNGLVDPDVIRYLVPAVIILDDRIIIQDAERTIFQRQACQTGRPGASVERETAFCENGSGCGA